MIDDYMLTWLHKDFWKENILTDKNVNTDGIETTVMSAVDKPVPVPGSHQMDGNNGGIAELMQDARLVDTEHKKTHVAVPHVPEIKKNRNYF